MKKSAAKTLGVAALGAAFAAAAAGTASAAAPATPSHTPNALDRVTQALPLNNAVGGVQAQNVLGATKLPAAADAAAPHVLPAVGTATQAAPGLLGGLPAGLPLPGLGG
ncbi:hypothetical protein GCM10020367_39700 [Streptomyces sannanensis]|uniref:ATP-binding protein n=1 Tax=Streptomyces sannanensis TaxID=285536 RepID=A0ABP6SEX2_9ACTN